MSKLHRRYVGLRLHCGDGCLIVHRYTFSVMALSLPCIFQSRILMLRLGWLGGVRAESTSEFGGSTGNAAIAEVKTARAK